MITLSDDDDGIDATGRRVGNPNNASSTSSTSLSTTESQTQPSSGHRRAHAGTRPSSPSFVLRKVYSYTHYFWVFLALTSVGLQATRTVDTPNSEMQEFVLFWGELVITILFDVEIVWRFLASLPDWRGFFRSDGGGNSGVGGSGVVVGMGGGGSISLGPGGVGGAATAAYGGYDYYGLAGPGGAQKRSGTGDNPHQRNHSAGQNAVAPLSGGGATVGVGNGNNWLDLILAIGSSIIQIPLIRNSQVYPWFTFFQLARFYRVILEVPRMKPLLVSGVNVAVRSWLSQLSFRISHF